MKNLIVNSLPTKTVESVEYSENSYSCGIDGVLTRDMAGWLILHFSDGTSLRIESVVDANIQIAPWNKEDNCFIN